MGVNSLPKTVPRQRRGCNLNLGPSAPQSSMLTTRLPSHPSHLCGSNLSDLLLLPSLSVYPIYTRNSKPAHLRATATRTTTGNTILGVKPTDQRDRTANRSSRNVVKSKNVSLIGVVNDCIGISAYRQRSAFKTWKMNDVIKILLHRAPPVNKPETAAVVITTR